MTLGRSQSQADGVRQGHEKARMVGCYSAAAVRASAWTTFCSRRKASAEGTAAAHRASCWRNMVAVRKAMLREDFLGSGPSQAGGQFPFACWRLVMQSVPFFSDEFLTYLRCRGCFLSALPIAHDGRVNVSTVTDTISLAFSDPDHNSPGDTERDLQSALDILSSSVRSSRPSAPAGNTRRIMHSPN